MNDRGLGSWMQRRARIAPDRTALVFGETRISYAELADRVARLANGLRALGVRRGDRVGWLGPNHPAFLETLFAASKLGAVLAPVNHRLDPDAIGGVLAMTSPAVVVAPPAVAAVALPPAARARVVVGEEFDALVAGSADEPIDDPVGLDDLCLLPHTSGTTGPPKGVMLTHGNVLWNVLNFLSCTDFRPDDVTVAIAPLFRVGGTGVNVLPVLFKGGAVVVPPSPDPEEILRLIERHRVTVGFGNPDLLQAMEAAPSWPTADLSSVRVILTGGAPVPERLIRTYLERGVTLVQGYGLSEAAPLVLLLERERALVKVGSAGRPPMFVDVTVVRPDGTTCETGETGELLVRGPNVMAGYWSDPEATRRAIDAGGWLRTGDAARVDGDGDYWIVDRVRDAYATAAGAVYPGDVERALAEHPGVVEAGVVGVPSGKAEVGAAFVVLAAGSAVTPDELLAFIHSRLARHQVPARVTVVDRLPRTTVGKLVRSELRRMAESSP